MAIILVTYDLKQPGRDYKPVHAYLKTFTYCKDLESVWLLDTTTGVATIRDNLMSRVDRNDALFVTKIQRDWGAFNYACGNWLNEAARNW